MCACMHLLLHMGLLLIMTLLLQACIFEQPGRLLASVPGLDSKRKKARHEGSSHMTATAM